MIKIINNFFEKTEFDKVIHHVKNNIYFTPRYLNNTTERIQKNYYGERFVLEQDKNLYDTFKKQAEKHFKIKINKTFDSGIDLRNLSEWLPHKDPGKINIFVMLDGPIGVTTGICFYTEEQLDMHVGFRPNRAVMFPSDYYHTPHKSDLKGIRRYTATIFVDEYEEV